MAESRPEVTGSASEHLPSGPVLNHFRHRGMLVRKPVRRICEIVNLVLRVRLGAVRNMDQSTSNINHGLDLIPHRERPGYIGEFPLLRRLSSDSNNRK